MKPTDSPPRMDRRVAIQWLLTATAALSLRQTDALGAQEGNILGPAKGYGSDPSMVKIYKPGDVWPLTFTESQRRTAIVLCDVIIPSDKTSPSASAVGVHDFIDEWISSPYPAQAGDRLLILEGLLWLDGEADRRFKKVYADLSFEQAALICSDISNASVAIAEVKKAVQFFKRYRDLTAGGYYTTPEGMKAIGYVGNTPSRTFEGPPLDALRHVGLA